MYPVYWASISLALAVAWVFPTGGRSPTLQQTLANLTMLQTWLRVPDLEVAYWTLGVELKFYVIMLAVFFAGRIRGSNRSCSSGSA